MAIAGDLRDLPISEVLNMIGRRTGVLKLTEIQGLEPLMLYLDAGSLRGFFEQDREIEDGMSVRSRLLTVMDAGEGRFEWNALAAEKLRGDLDIPVLRLFGIIAAAVDESGAYRDYFVDPKMVFKTLSAPNLWLDTNLFVFLEGAKAFLERGVTAEALARSLHLDLAQVQNHLFKLRSVGKIAPVEPA